MMRRKDPHTEQGHLQTDSMTIENTQGSVRSIRSMRRDEVISKGVYILERATSMYGYIFKLFVEIDGATELRIQGDLVSVHLLLAVIRTR